MTDRRLTFSAGHPDPEWLGALHDGELTAAEAGEIQAHVSGCPDCRLRLAELAELSSLAPELEAPLPAAADWPRLTDRILERVAAERAAAHSAAAAGPRGRVASASGRQDDPGAGLPFEVRPARGAAWRWLMPLAAVCGVALLSWRLLLSGSSMMGEVGSPTPAPRTRSLPQVQSPGSATKEMAGEALRKDEPAAEASGPLAARDAPHNDQSAPAFAPPAGPPASAATGPSAESMKRAAPPTGNAAAPPAPDLLGQAAPAAPQGAPVEGTWAAEGAADADPGVSGGSVAVLGELAPPLLEEYRARLAAGTPFDSLLARSGREADSLSARFLPVMGAARNEADRARDAATEMKATRSTAAVASAAPPDSLTLERAIAIEEARLELLKERRPAFDRAAIEARLTALRKIRRKQGP